VRRQLARILSVDVDGIGTLTQIAEKWRPYRSWVSLLFRAQLENRPHEIAGGARRLYGADLAGRGGSYGMHIQ
jgi:hypothetical protein